jgi:uncharacterized BrkB/YihY/UPF0761 family membrane protein
MKHSWTVLGLLLLLVASVSILIYLLVEGVVKWSIPWILLIWLWVFGILALVGGIARLAGWLPRKKKN